MASHDASQPLGTPRRSREGAAASPEARRPAPASQSNPRGKGGSHDPHVSRSRSARPSRSVPCSCSRCSRAAAGAKTVAPSSGSSPPTGCSTRVPATSSRAETVRTDPAADCIRPAPAAAARASSSRSRPRSACSPPLPAPTPRVRPLSVTDEFGFGLALCADRRRRRSAGHFWYLKRNHSRAHRRRRPGADLQRRSAALSTWRRTTSRRRTRLSSSCVPRRARSPASRSRSPSPRTAASPIRILPSRRVARRSPRPGRRSQARTAP